MSRRIGFPVVFLSVFMAILLAGCNPQSEQQGQTEEAADSGNQAPEPAAEECLNCGVIVDIQPVTTEGDTSGAGAVIGAVVGGLLGNQVGGGSGKDAATAIGAVGGALAGNEVEKKRNAVTYYQVTVDLNDGSRKVVNVNSPQGIQPGMEVEVVGNDIHVL